ncbi:hypothetical protein EsH8_II_000369 [Colletotrichum jinshuiense]
MGRPPISGYCHTCRRRRVKCDKGLPACQRCLKSGHKCLGYETPLRMQNFAAVAEPNGSHQLARVWNSSATTPAALSIPPELPLIAFRDRMAFSHLLANYRWAPFWKPLLRMSLEGSSQSDVIKVDYTGSLATALGFMGSSVKEPNMLADGYELNGQVIKSLQSALLAKSKQELARWAFTIIILSLYQYAVENQANIPHYYGMSRIIESCGPECFQQEPMLTYLRQMRALHACNSFNHKERTFFEEKRWKSLPWRFQTKTSHDLLMDIFVDIPGLTTSVGSFSGPLYEEEKSLAHAKILELFSKLYNWRRQWQNANQNAATEIFSPQDADNISTPWIRDMISRSLSLKTSEQAAELIIYNAALIQLMNLQALLDTGVRDPQPFPGTISPSILKPAADPLYMPHEIKHRWQPSIEALRLMRCSTKLLSANEGSVMLAASPIGIIYNSLLANEGLGRCFISATTGPSDYEILETELSIFRF